MQAVAQVLRASAAGAAELLQRMAAQSATAAPWQCSKPPVVFVVGTTGAGKTRLAVEIAAKHGGEVVNADVIQMYTHLNIASAKATVEEAQGVPHHLFSFLPPTAAFTVRDYHALATDMLKRVHARGKVPVIVGGTMYYTQALLSGTMLSEGGEGASDPEVWELPCGTHVTLAGPAPTPEVMETLYTALEKVDPPMAHRLHRHDWRKIARALTVWKRSGVAQSAHVAAQAEEERPCPYDVRVLWPRSNREVLTERLNRRVAGMVSAGLLQEVAALHAALASGDTTPPEAPAFVGASADTADLWAGHTLCTSAAGAAALDPSSHGALSAIGYREFEAYLQEPADSPAAPGLLQAALGTLELKTRQYAMKQLSWIRNRFIARGLTVHCFDSSQVTQWDSLVGGPASAQVADLLKGVGNDAQAVPGASDAARLAAWERHTCPVCDVECVGVKAWEDHRASGKHRRRLAAAARLPREWLAMYEAKRSGGATHQQAQASVQAVPRFAGLDHDAATEAVAEGQAPAPKRARRGD